jgi:serine/threonine protein kinase
VADFGLAANVNGPYNNGFLYKKVGTKGFRAPEIHEGEYKGI